MKKEGTKDKWWNMMFKKFDTDNDGYVSWDEAWYYLKANKP